MEHTKGEWTVIDSGGRVMLKAVGEPQIICTLETRPLKITPEVQANALLIAAAPKLLAACKYLLADLEGTAELLELDEVPEHIKLSVIEGRNAIQAAIDY